jgi:diaminohydroxyphosphoribosylaminopyrimidine deaminase/5-amino-6-(5-phosphoribosylamino)uracil reductase
MAGKTEDLRFMSRAIELARRGEGKTGFRPLVGCVIVKKGKIIAEAQPNDKGLPHAEALALKKAGRRAEGATLYVNLEPCSWHKDKVAPACCEAVANAGIARVVCAIKDPHPKINGRGIRFLRKAGIEVSVGLCRKEAGALNEQWTKFITKGLPFVVLKMAVSLDGKIWSERTKAISNRMELEYAHRLRSKYQAILVGVGTIAKDNPRLTSRIPGGHDPVRVIIDSELRSSVDAKAFSNANAMVFTTSRADKEKADSLRKKGIAVYGAGNGREVDLGEVLRKLAEMKISGVMVEGGRGMATSFLDKRMVDKVIMAIAPKILGRGVGLVGDSLNTGIMLKDVEIAILGDNAVVSGYPIYGKIIR